MPVCKRPVERFRIIDGCFTSQKKEWTMAELLKKLEEKGISISERTFRADLEFLRADPPRGYGAKIPYCDYKKVYAYAPGQQSIFTVPMTPQIETAITVIELLAQDEAFKILLPLISAIQTRR